MSQCQESQYLLNSSTKQPTKPTYKILKMKFAIVFSLCIVAALAAPADKPVAEILKNENNITEDGYNFA